MPDWICSSSSGPTGWSRFYFYHAGPPDRACPPTWSGDQRVSLIQSCHCPPPAWPGDCPRFTGAWPDDPVPFSSLSSLTGQSSFYCLDSPIESWNDRICYWNQPTQLREEPDISLCEWRIGHKVCFLEDPSKINMNKQNDLGGICISWKEWVPFCSWQGFSS